MKHFLNLGRYAQQIPQSEPLPGSTQTLNHAGGYTWEVTDEARLHRFLILNTTNGSYYVGERELTKENLAVVDRLLASGKGRQVVDTIVAISRAGRAASNDPALFALARCAAADDVEVRRAALQALPQVARTGTHLLHFVAYVKQFRGWGRAYRHAVASWFTTHGARHLAYQMLKYQQRDGYSQRDLLRLAHPTPPTESHNILYHWAARGWDGIGEQPHPNEDVQIIWAAEKAKRSQDAREVARLVRDYRLPREAVPTQFAHAVPVWEALLEDMPMEAMLRNLATMTREKVLVPLGAATQVVTERLRDQERIRSARLHPVKILAALATYTGGKSVRGQHTWTPLPQIIDALDDAFTLSFAAVEPTNKRVLVAIDTSGSMHVGQVNGIPNLPLPTACAAMAVLFAKTEPHTHIIGVDHTIQELDINPAHRLYDVIRALKGIGGGGTNLSLPVLYALQRRLTVDAFVILTDNETWAGQQHPTQALKQYRARINPAAKIITVQMTATSPTINDPNDRRTLDIVGFDTMVPLLIADFLRDQW